MINWLDIALIFILILSATIGWSRGLIRQSFDLLAIFASYFVALRYGNDFVTWLSNYLPLVGWLPAWLSQPTLLGFAVGDILARLIGFFLLFFAVRLLFKLVGGLLHGIFSLPVLGTVNGLGGLLFGFLKGFLLVLIFVGAANLISTPYWQRTLTESSVASSILKIVPVVYRQMMEFLLKDLTV